MIDHNRSPNGTEPVQRGHDTCAQSSHTSHVPDIHPAHSVSHPQQPESVLAPKKDEADISTVHSTGMTSFVSDKPTVPDSRPWRTTFFRWAPLSGMFCMLLSVLSILVSLSILVGSKDVPVASWTVEPSAYLAICTAIANQALRFAAFQGVIICWWLRASRGATLRQLHFDWRAGTTLFGALTTGRNMGFIGLACVFSTLVAVDGPLLQKATSVRSAPLNQSVPLNVSMAPEMPTDFSGGWYRLGHGSSQTVWSAFWDETIPTVNGSTSNYLIPFIKTYSPLSEAWLKGYEMKNFVHGCPEHARCDAKIYAPALAPTSCETRIVPVNFTEEYPWPKRGSYASAPLNRLGFMLDSTLLVGDGYETVNLITAYSHVDQCAGILNVSICTLSSAVGEYDIQVKDNTVTLFSAIPRIIAIANNTRVGHDWYDSGPSHTSTLGGVVQLGVYQTQGTNIMYNDPHQAQSLTQYSLGYTLEKFRIYDGIAKCSSFSDPQEFAISNYNRIMFEAGMIAAKTHNASYLEAHMDPGLRVESIVTGHVQGHQNVYHTDLHWFAAAALLEFISIGLILPTYLGWWRLGRPVSFSPIEIAKAFEAPILVNCNSNSSGRDIAQTTVGDNRVQYGLTRATGGIKLTFAHPTTVERPWQNARFDV